MLDGCLSCHEDCIDRLRDGPCHEEVWHLVEQLSHGSPAVLHIESGVGPHPLHEPIPDCRWHLRLLNLHRL